MTHFICIDEATSPAECQKVVEFGVCVFDVIVAESARVGIIEVCVHERQRNLVALGRGVGWVDFWGITLQLRYLCIFP